MHSDSVKGKETEMATGPVVPHLCRPSEELNQEGAIDVKGRMEEESTAGLKLSLCSEWCVSGCTREQ